MMKFCYSVSPSPVECDGLHALIAKNELQNNFLGGALLSGIPYRLVYLQDPETNQMQNALVLSEGRPGNFSHPLTEKELELFCEGIIQHQVPLTRVVLPAALSSKFISFMESKNNPVKWGLHMRQRLFSLNELPILPSYDGKNPNLSGELKEILEEEYRKAAEWMREFNLSVNVTHKVGSVEEFVPTIQAKIVKKEIFFWKLSSGESVSMITFQPVSKSGARITCVWTPEQFRRKGYATHMLYALCLKLMTSSCQFLCLFTDLDNQTSNHIYPAVGFKPVEDLNLLSIQS